MDRPTRCHRLSVLVLPLAALIALLSLQIVPGEATADHAPAIELATELAAPQNGVSGTIVIPIYPGWPFPCPPWPTMVPPSGVPTPMPRPSPTPGPATGLNYRVCPQIVNRVPAAVQQDALATPWKIYGYGMLLNPSVPSHPVWNGYRTWLTLLDYGKPWHPCNPVVWKAGCP